MIPSLDYLGFVGGGGDDVLSQVDFFAGGLVRVGESLGTLGPGVLQDVLGCGSLGRVDVQTTRQQIR